MKAENELSLNQTFGNNRESVSPFSDLTAHELIDQLRASENRYRTLFNSIDEAFCIIQVLFDATDKAVDYLFLDVNAQFERQTGLHEPLGKTAREQLPDLEKHWFEIYGAVALTGVPKRFSEGSETMGRWFDVYAFRLGEPTDRIVAVIFSDISQRKQAELERERLLLQLEGERAKFAYIFAKAPAFVTTLSGPLHKFELTNPAYLKLIGHRDVEGKNIREALPEIEGQGFIELLDDVFQSGKAYIGRETSVHLQWEPEGALEERFVDFVFQPMFESDGAVQGIFVHGFDITEQVNARKEIEEAKRSAETASQRAEEANRTKDEFLATLSHELRTPLTAIMGWTSILQSGKATLEETERGLSTIERNSRAQAQLIEDILDVSRVVTGKMRLDVQPVDLGVVLEEAVHTVLPAAQMREVRIQRVIDAGAILVSGDPARLQQIIWNLLSNAIKFTPKGGRVQIRLERINSHVEIVIVDSGQGITPEVLPHVFDRFRQADSSSTRAYGGLGLGLSIVRHLIELHGGSVEAYSEGQGKGSTFTVKLPVIAVQNIVERSESAEPRAHPRINQNPVQGEGPRLDGLEVLIVDDQDDTRTLLGLVLQKSGAQVITAGSAAEAFRVIQELRPDVLLSDIGMPGEDGFTLIKKVRALSPESGGQTPAAALTAFARVEDRVKAMRAGFQTHLPKPIDPVELVTVVATLAGRHDEG